MFGIKDYLTTCCYKIYSVFVGTAASQILYCSQSETHTISPTEIFLNFLTYPEDPNTLIDLRMSAVVIMSHLDRLVVPYLQPSTTQKVSSSFPQSQNE